MKILAIDSSGLTASVAIAEDDNLLAEYTVNNKKTHSQTLLPMLDEIVKATDTDLEELDAIAVASGPGSFTGLRIGASTVKGLALALDKPVVPVPTLEGLTYNLWGCEGLICPIMDARRNQVYTGVYRFKRGQFITETEQLPCDIDEIISILANKNKTVTFVGDGIQVHSEHILLKMPEAMLAPAHMNKQHAGSIAFAGMVRFNKKQYINGDDFAPEYLRMSQAERERKEKQGDVDE